MVQISGSQGVQFLNDVEWYEGDYKNGKFHGQGTETWSNGDKYEGEWKNGKLDSQGTYTKPDGENYEEDSGKKQILRGKEETKSKQHLS